MKKILIVVDDTKTSKSVISTFHNSVWNPESVTLLHVQKLQGHSLMIDMLGEAEMATLKESLEGTEYKEKLDRMSEKILDHYKQQLENKGSFSLSGIVRSGHPADEILKVADEERVDMIILGSHGHKGLTRLFTGSVAEDVGKRAAIPVIVAKRPVVCEEAYSWRDAYAAVTVTTLIVLAMFLLEAFL
jgi:nucleotide-binding universal stress UspA family protein